MKQLQFTATTIAPFVTSVLDKLDHDGQVAFAFMLYRNLDWADFVPMIPEISTLNDVIDLTAYSSIVLDEVLEQVHFANNFRFCTEHGLGTMWGLAFGVDSFQYRKMHRIGDVMVIECDDVFLSPYRMGVAHETIESALTMSLFEWKWEHAEALRRSK